MGFEGLDFVGMDIESGEFHVPFFAVRSDSGGVAAGLPGLMAEMFGCFAAELMPKLIVWQQLRLSGTARSRKVKAIWRNPCDWTKWSPHVLSGVRRFSTGGDRQTSDQTSFWRATRCGLEMTGC